MAEELTTQLSAAGILRLTMNRPAVLNAFDEQQIERMLAALQQAQGNPAVRVLVLAGEGRHFCAGGDLNYMQRMSHNSYAENLADAGQLATLMHTLNSFPKPTIARVQGAAYGGGVGLVSCCDIAIGTPQTRLSLSEVKVGMAPATIAPYVLRAIGERQARRYFISAEVIDAGRAEAIGLLHEVVDESALDQRVEEIAAQLLGNAPEGMRHAKQVASELAQGAIDEAMIARTVKLIAHLRESDEGREGLAAFLQKRPANWVVNNDD